MLALLFDGQGTQKSGMYNEFRNFKIFRDTYIEASDILNIDVNEICSTMSKKELGKTFNTQIAVFVHSIALYRLLNANMKLDPDYLLGHSLGQYAACVVGGSLKFKDGLILLRERSKLMTNLSPEGAMLAVKGVPVNKIEDLCNQIGRIEISLINSQTQIVVSGDSDSVTKLKLMIMDVFAIQTIRLDVNRAFHCSLMKDVQEQYHDSLRKVEFKNSKVPIILNSTAKLSCDKKDLFEELSTHITKPVMWKDSILLFDNDKPITTIEIGSGKFLSSLQNEIFPNSNIYTCTNLTSVEKIWKYFN